MVQITRGYHVNFSVWLSTIGIREKMADTEAETGKCPERIGMARATRPKDGTLERAAVQSCCEILSVHATDAMVCTGWWADLNCCHPFQIIGTLFIHGTGLNSNSIAAELRHCMFTIAGHINAYQLILMDSDSLLSQAAADQHDLLGCFEVEPLAKW